MTPPAVFPVIFLPFTLTTSTNQRFPPPSPHNNPLSLLFPGQPGLLTISRSNNQDGQQVKQASAHCASTPSVPC